MTPALFALLAAVLLSTGFELHLLGRQIRHVRAHRGAVPADFADAIDLASHQKAADYTVAKARLEMVGEVVQLGVLAALLIGGIDLVYGALGAAGLEGDARSVAFVVATSLLGSLASLPLAVYGTFVIEERFGFNRTSWGLFIKDKLKGQAIGVGLTVPLLLGLLWLMERVSGLWWLYAWAGFMAFAAAMMVVFPLYIAPRFNSFTPLPEGDLRARLEALLARCGFRAQGLFVMDGSKRSAHGNAYFTGFGRAKRVVLFDTLVEKSAPDEIEAILAHELGHAHHKHILWGFARLCALALLFFWGFAQAFAAPGFLAAFGIASVDPVVALTVFLYCLGPFAPLTQPLGNWLSRRAEFQADAFARQATGAEPMIRALVKLYKDNAATLTPDPLYSLVHHSHPPAAVRVGALRAPQAA